MSVWMYLIIFIFGFLLSFLMNKLKDFMYVKLHLWEDAKYKNNKEYFCWSLFTGAGMVVVIGSIVILSGNPLVV